jgi:hypothetical protein
MAINSLANARTGRNRHYIGGHAHAHKGFA